TCPYCYVKCEVQPSLVFTDTLREKIDYMVNDLSIKDFIVYVHPFVDAYLKKGFISLARRWKFQIGGSFKILPDQSLAYLQYRIIDKDKNEVDLKEEKDLETSTSKTKSKAKTRGTED
ncbi:MAG: hypothetical protein K2H32_09800, partial [Muribaculaceae bacterium]|nr:hypothetical protein [Muribaculaceae bacterium]